MKIRMAALAAALGVFALVSRLSRGEEARARLETLETRALRTNASRAATSRSSVRTERPSRTSARASASRHTADCSPPVSSSRLVRRRPCPMRSSVTFSSRRHLSRRTHLRLPRRSAGIWLPGQRGERPDRDRRRGRCQVVAGAVVGPFPTAVLLRIWLTDFHAPVFTFYSDGNHATAAGTNPRLVSIRDSLFGTITTGPLLSPAGDGNLNVVVTIA